MHQDSHLIADIVLFVTEQGGAGDAISRDNRGSDVECLFSKRTGGGQIRVDV